MTYLTFFFALSSKPSVHFTLEESSQFQLAPFQMLNTHMCHHCSFGDSFPVISLKLMIG